MSIISNGMVVTVVPVPSISAIDIAGTQSLTLGAYIETDQKYK